MMSTAHQLSLKGQAQSRKTKAMYPARCAPRNICRAGVDAIRNIFGRRTSQDDGVDGMVAGQRKVCACCDATYPPHNWAFPNFPGCTYEPDVC
jgi:hypothetical protein